MSARVPGSRRKRGSRLDLTIRVLVGVAVGVLAVVSGAISFDHMHLLALAHHQAGWRASAFPISVDGLEMVASLVILAEHREHGRASSVLPWIALAAGTGASLAANIAVGAPHDLVGRAISGWPAVALLVTLKLAAGRLTGPVRSVGPVRSTRSVLDLGGSGWSLDGPDRSEDGPSGAAAGRQRSGEADQRSEQRPDVVPDRAWTELNELVSHARRVRDQVRAEGLRVTRRELATRLRAEGRSVSNERATALVRALAAGTTRPRAVDIRPVAPQRPEPPASGLPYERESEASAA